MRAHKFVNNGTHACGLARLSMYSKHKKKSERMSKLRFRRALFFSYSN